MEYVLGLNKTLIAFFQIFKRLVTYFSTYILDRRRQRSADVVHFKYECESMNGISVK